jgi:hypothetical protein
MAGQNIVAALMAGLLGAPGDLLSRILFYNCSMDKAWTMFFFFFFISFVSGFFFLLNKIEPGTEPCSKSFDAFIIVIPILTILFKVLIPYLIENKLISTALTFILLVIMYAIIRMVKYNSSCKIMFAEKYKGPGKTQLIKAATTALITLLAIAIFNALSPFGQMIPIIGIAFKIWGFLGKVPGLQTALPLTLAHIITNLLNNNKSNMITTCCNPEDNC